MKVEFLKDIFNAGTKLYEAGKTYDGDLARYVRRGDAVEVKGKSTASAASEEAGEPVKGTKGKGK